MRSVVFIGILACSEIDEYAFDVQVVDQRICDNDRIYQVSGVIHLCYVVKEHGAALLGNEPRFGVVGESDPVGDRGNRVGVIREQISRVVLIAFLIFFFSNNYFTCLIFYVKVIIYLKSCLVNSCLT